MGYIRKISEGGQVLLFENGNYIVFDGIFGESSSSSSSSSNSSSSSSSNSSSRSSSSSSSSSSNSSSSSSSNSSSSNKAGHWIKFELVFTCSDNTNYGYGYGYKLLSFVYSGDSKQDHEQTVWTEVYKEPRATIGWESLRFFEDPFHEHTGEYYLGFYPKPLPQAPFGFCPAPEIDQISPRLPPSGDKMLDFNRDRFSGYNLPTIKLNDGFEYYVVGVHPYLQNQPIFWQTPAYDIGVSSAGGHVHPIYTSPKSIVDPNKEKPDSPNLPI